MDELLKISPYGIHMYGSYHYEAKTKRESIQDEYDRRINLSIKEIKEKINKLTDKK